MPSTIGIVASGEDVLNDAVFWVDAGLSSVSSGALTNLGTGGSALNAQFGSTSGTDSFDPQLLTHTGTNYLYRTAGNHATCPDNANYTVTSSISYRFAVSADDWTPTTQAYFGGHYEGSGSQRSSLCGIATSGLPAMLVSSDGVIGLTTTASVAPTVTDGSAILLRYDWLAAGATIRFYTKSFDAATCYADCVSDSGWTQLGVDRSTAATSLFNPAAPMYVAGHSAATLEGRSYATAVKVDGVLQVGADFTSGITSGAQTTFTESSANAATVTINRATSGRKSVAVVRNVLSFGTDDYLEVADSDLLDFGASDSFTVMAVVRQWATPTNFGRIIDKALVSSTGWSMSNSGTASGLYGGISDGTNSASRSNLSTYTLGALRLSAIRVDRSAQTLLTYTNNTASTTTSTSSVGSIANALPMRIGRMGDTGTGYQDMELVAAAVWRRALNTNEIATLTARYT